MRTLHLVGSPTAPPPLIERTTELDALDAAVRGGSGVVVLEAAAGLGKTALLEHAAGLAADAGYLVRRAAPGPLERHFAYGVVRALLEAPLRALGPDLDGAAAEAAELLRAGGEAGADSTRLAHSVLWLCSELAAERPLALFVDDAQWADRASLEVLAYLGRRVEDLPLLIVVAARGGDPLLSLLGTARSATVLNPAPLSPRGAALLMPGTPDTVARECHRATAGNPWLLSELGAEAISANPAVTPSARSVVRRRLAELSPRDRAVVEALAVIGDSGPPHVAAAVAGVPVGELGPAREALEVAGLLAPGGRRFAHALIAAAIAAEETPTERERLHREAARALMADRADPRLIASHLLECSPHADPEVTEHLLAAASAAMERGQPRAAAAYFERALEERAPGDDRGTMLAQLGTVAFDAGLPDSRRRLHEALPEVRDRDSRIDVLTRLASLNLVQPGDGELVGLFDAELAHESDPDVRLAIEAARLDALLTVPRAPLRARATRRRDRRVTRGRPAAPARRARASRVGRHRARHGRRRDRRDAGAGGARGRAAAGGGAPAAGVRDLRAGADDGRPSRGGARDHGPARRGGAARVAAAARRGRVVRGRARPPDRPRGRCRELRPARSGARRRGAQYVHRRRHRGADPRARRARRVRRGTRAAAPVRARRRAGRAAVADRHPPRPRTPRAGRGRLRARARRSGQDRRAARRAGPAEPFTRAMALDGGAGPGSPRSPDRGGVRRRRGTRAGRALRRPARDRRRAPRPRGRGAGSRPRASRSASAA